MGTPLLVSERCKVLEEPTASQGQSFFWTERYGFQWVEPLLPLLVGLVNYTSIIRGVTAYGESGVGTSQLRAVTCTPLGVLTALGTDGTLGVPPTLAEHLCSAMAITPDGTVIVGMAYDPIYGKGQVFKYTSGTGMVRIPRLPSGVNMFWRSQLLTELPWVATDCTVTTGATDPDSGGNAQTIEATANDGTVYQTVPIQTATANRTFSIYVRRVTGTGDVSITANGSSFDVVAVTGSWVRYSTTQSVAPSSVAIGIKLAVLGDVVEVAFAQYETAASPSVYAPTGSSYYKCCITQGSNEIPEYMGVSDDGLTIYGSGDFEDIGHSSFIWTAAAGWTYLQLSPAASWDRHVATSASSDCSIIAGTSATSSAKLSWSWTAAGGVELISPLPDGFVSTYNWNVSRDGTALSGMIISDLGEIRMAVKGGNIVRGATRPVSTLSDSFFDFAQDVS